MTDDSGLFLCFWVFSETCGYGSADKPISLYSARGMAFLEMLGKEWGVSPQARWEPKSGKRLDGQTGQVVGGRSMGE